MAPTTASPAGNDSNSGLDAAHPWATPNHAVVCGDVIIAAAGTYGAGSLNSTFGSVSSCPSSSGGIDGAGGIYFAVLLCGGVNLEACQVAGADPNCGAGTCPLVETDNSNWAIEGFKVNGGGPDNRAFETNACGSGTTIVHHTAFINDIAYNARQGYDINECALNHNIPGNGGDYWAVVGSIAQNAAQDGICLAAVDGVGPAPFDFAAGTHLLVYGSFAWNQPGNGCGIDVENFMFDTPDAHGFTNQQVMMNNMGWNAYRYGIQIFMQGINNIAGSHTYLFNNTTFNNNTINDGGKGDINIQNDNQGAVTIVAQNNIAAGAQSTQCGLLLGGSGGPGSLVNVTLGGTGNENVANASNPSNDVCVFNGGPAGTNYLVDPSFRNTTDLLSNRLGVPTCNTINVTQCMGWDATTQVLTTPSAISDLTPTNASGCGGTSCATKGYQPPSTTCVSNGNIYTFYPTWLKGIVYLHWTGTAIEQRHDLVTMPCGL